MHTHKLFANELAYED